MEQRPLEDRIDEAYNLGVSHAQSGPGFTPPYPIGTPERRAWTQGYDNTPKGVPVQTVRTGPAPGNLPNVEPAEAPSPTLKMATGYSDYNKLLADAERAGRVAFSTGARIEQNPYDQPHLQLRGPADAWNRGYSAEEQAEQKRGMDRIRESLQNGGPGMAAAVREMESPLSVRDLAALATFPLFTRHYLDQQQADGSNGYGYDLQSAARDAVVAADELVKELAK